jgi:hypothetical protein
MWFEGDRWVLRPLLHDHRPGHEGMRVAVIGIDPRLGECVREHVVGPERRRPRTNCNRSIVIRPEPDPFGLKSRFTEEQILIAMQQVVARRELDEVAEAAANCQLVPERRDDSWRQHHAVTSNQFRRARKRRKAGNQSQHLSGQRPAESRMIANHSGEG